MKTCDAVFELFLNYACQAKCGFCYNPPITDELLRRELSFEQAAASLYAAAKGGAKRLNLHGGEVTLRDDLPKILRLAVKVGFKELTLITNGVKLGDARYAKSLVAAGVTNVRLSLHAADAKTHDAIVKVPGALERALRGAEHLRKLKIPLGLNFVLIRENLPKLPELAKRFVASGLFDELIVYFPHEQGMMALNAADIGVTYDQARRPLLDAAKAVELGRLLIANVPPCAAPELADLLLDWEKEPGEAASAMVSPEGSRTDLDEMKDAQRGEVAACRSCVLRERCRGVEPAYVKRRGDDEFRALASVPPALAAVAR